MRRLVLAVATAAALAVGRADSATANLDTDGFAFDGKTTYCEGVRDAKAPLQFNQELVTSAGKCPIALDMKATVRNVANSNAIEVWVDWSAALASGDVAQSLYPRVLDHTSGGLQPIIASLVRACKSGSNCATDEDVVVPAVAPGDATTTGSFDDDNHKTLRSYVFGFPGAVDHIVVAKIVLPGDPQLNVSAIEFLTFQRVQSSGDGVVPGTVKPYGDQERAGNITRQTPVLMITPSQKSTINVNATETESGALGASKSSAGNKSTIILLSAIGGLGCVAVIAFFALAKREKNVPPPLDDGNDSNPTVYRLTDAAKQAPSVQISTQPHPPKRAHHQHQAQAKPWAAQPRHQQPAVEHKADNIPQHRPAPVADADHALSIDSYGDMLVTSTSLLNSLHDSQASSAHTSFSSLSDSVVSETMSFSSLLDSGVSDLSLLNSLHDSAVGLPVANHRRRRASSASSTLDELEDNLSFGDDSSRLFNSTQLTAVLQHPRSTAHDDDNDLMTTESRLTWRDSDLSDASDLERLTLPIHERAHRQ